MIRSLRVLLCIAVLATCALAQTTLNGAGATFPYPIYSKWFNEYHNLHSNIQINYQSIGSGGGIRQVQAGTVDFGASDGPMGDEQIAQSKVKVLHVPTVLGAVVPAYNIPGVNGEVKFTPDVLADIYLGKITKWNDGRITKVNPGVNFPDQNITVVHRSDGSGTTYIFTDYLSSVSPAWASKVGKGVAVQWPTGLGANGNVGVAQQVKDSPGGIGYVELTYAKQNHMAYADLKNAAGHYVAPTLESMSAAVSTASIPDDFRFSMVNAPRATAYPIAGASWLILFQKQADATRGRKLVEFIRWAVTDGQKLSSKLDYGPLPEELVQRILKQADQVSY